MLAALGQGGTSFDALYVNVNGQSGYFDRSLEAYGREGEPCSRCGTPIRRVTFMNRSSFFCPVCQPAPPRARRPRWRCPDLRRVLAEPYLRETLVDGPDGPHPLAPPEGTSMAKALLGYSTGTDPRVAHRQAAENRILRQRVVDLEEAVLRLQKENDALAALATESVDEAVARDGSLAHT